MAKVSKMPGCRCQFYINGKCLYEEMLNPGYNNDWRCRIIKELEKEYDRLLHQAEAFKLDEKTFSDLWEQRMEEHLKSTVVCRKMIPHEDDEFPPVLRRMMIFVPWNWMTVRVCVPGLSRVKIKPCGIDLFLLMGCVF